MLTFADLKNYKFTYWFGYPTFIPENSFVHITSESFDSTMDLNIFNGTNNTPIFGLIEQSGNYSTMSFENSLQDSSRNDLIFVINYSRVRKNNENEYIFPWHLRNVLAYFALKDIGGSFHGGKVVKILLIHHTSESGISFISMIILMSLSNHNTLFLILVQLSPIFSVLLPHNAFPNKGK